MPKIKFLLLAVKDFNPGYGDSAYMMCIVDFLLECVELSYRTGNPLAFFLKSMSSCDYSVLETST